MDSTDNSAIMTIDLKRSRFRIHKSTLNKMGNPQYVQFLVNPEEMFIAILGSDRPLAGGTANRVKLVQLPNHSIEFYSNTLLYWPQPLLYIRSAWEHRQKNVFLPYPNRSAPSLHFPRSPS